ncbi:CBS domain-containing protein CBSX3, mitochondrial [Gracilariopsis chorda]|uniref:CBS domain-containing protein CBSX3, mitochondrial n=1 Tax=Gracilariopsis chorda TaxID=448386 RepID=A0A2V3IK21_9FLOR|nr:CBS domain-containing protein CBSX3, mitochondrial [Gracilariopsis chorda]|eukprot:PXF42399.1 CBS domain-containing protein CBSX3, mitochondrial [Gracilariopsis chorda]
MSLLRRSALLFRTITAQQFRPLASTPTAQPATPPESETKSSGSDRGLGTVRDVLKTKGEKFFYTFGDALVYDAVKEMVKHNIGSLIIVEGDDKKPVGIVTETDYLNKVIVRGRSSKSTLVRDIMSTKKFTFVNPDATLTECMELMTVRRIRHIPVVEEGSHKVLGMVSIGDIVSELVAAHKREGEHMRSFISGSY